MTARATIATLRGVRLSAPLSASLAHEIGLTLVTPPDPADTGTAVPPPQPAAPCPRLGPSMATALDLLKQAGGPLTRDWLRDARGYRDTQASNLISSLAKLVDLGLATVSRIGPQALAWTITEAGRAWTPPTDRQVTDADILAAVARIHDQRPGSQTIRWWGEDPRWPATAGRICEAVGWPGTRPRIAAMRLRMDALVIAGALTTAQVRRGGGMTPVYWIATDSPTPAPPDRTA